MVLVDRFTLQHTASPSRREVRSFFRKYFDASAKFHIFTDWWRWLSLCAFIITLWTWFQKPRVRSTDDFPSSVILILTIKIIDKRNDLKIQMSHNIFERNLMKRERRILPIVPLNVAEYLEIKINNEGKRFLELLKKSFQLQMLQLLTAVDSPLERLGTFTRLSIGLKLNVWW